MTTDKDLKRRIRARMEKTGESYTTARSQMLRPQSVPLPDHYHDLVGVSDDAVAAKTGMNWPQWVETLDQAGARTMEHGAIAKWVHARIGLDWWAQTVTVGYERIRGLRDVGQRRGGGYEASKSRTFPVPVDTLFAAFAEDARRRQWLGSAVTLRKATPNKSVRMNREDGGSVEVYFTQKGLAKSSVQVVQGKLPSKEVADGVKVFWSERLDELGSLLR
jgi:hypothetical protein